VRGPRSRAVLTAAECHYDGKAGGVIVRGTLVARTIGVTVADGEDVAGGVDEGRTAEVGDGRGV